MNENDVNDLGERLRDSNLALRAIQEAVQDAVRTHKLLGRPIVTWRDGKVVWVPPEEIDLPEEKNGAPHH